MAFELWQNINHSFNYGNVFHPAMCYKPEGKNGWCGDSCIFFPSRQDFKIFNK